MEHNATESKGNAMRGLAALKQATASLARQQHNQEQTARLPNDSGGVPSIPSAKAHPPATTTDETPGHHLSDAHPTHPHHAGLAHRGSTKKIPDPSELRLEGGQDDGASDKQPIEPASHGKSAQHSTPVDRSRTVSHTSDPESSQTEDWENSPLNRFLKEKIKTSGNSGQSVVKMTEHAGPASGSKPKTPEPSHDKALTESSKIEHQPDHSTGLASPPPADTPRPPLADASPFHERPVDTSIPAHKVTSAPPDSTPHWVKVVAKQLLRSLAMPAHTTNHAYGATPSHQRRKQPETVKNIPFISESVTGPKLAVPAPLEPIRTLAAAKKITPSNQRNAATPVAAKAKAPANPFHDNPKVAKPILRPQPTPPAKGNDAPNKIQIKPADTKRTESGKNQDETVRSVAADIQRKQAVAHVGALLHEMADQVPDREHHPIPVARPTHPPKDHTSERKASSPVTQPKPTVTLGQDKPKPTVTVKQEQKSKPTLPQAASTTNRAVHVAPTHHAPKGVTVQATSLPKNIAILQSAKTGDVTQPQRQQTTPQSPHRESVSQHAESRSNTPPPQKPTPSQPPPEPNAIGRLTQTTTMGSLTLPGGTIRVPSSTKVTINPGTGNTQPQTTEVAAVGHTGHSRPIKAPQKAARLVVTIPAKESRPAGQTKVPMSDKTPKGYHRNTPDTLDTHRLHTPAEPGNNVLEAVPSKIGKNNPVEVWQVPVEGLSAGFVHLLGDAVGGVVSLVSGSKTKKKQVQPQTIVGKSSPQSLPHAAIRHRPAAGLDVATDTLSGGIWGILTGVAQIAGGSINIVLGSLGTLGGVIVQAASKIGIKSKD